MHNGNSIIGLVQDLRQQVKTFIQEEIRLTKKELSENASSAAKNSVNLAVGGFVAYAGLIVFLAGLGALLGFILQRLGLNPLLAIFIGLGVVGLIVLGVGALLLLKGLRCFKQQSLAPQKTFDTLRRLKGKTATEPQPAAEAENETRSSDQIRASVLATENKMGQTLAEIGDRVTFVNLRRQADVAIRKNPYDWGLVAAGAGIPASYLVKGKRRGT